VDHFEYRGGDLHAEDVAVSSIAQSIGTPVYVYSRATIERHWHAFDDAFGDHPHSICYAVKANSNLAVLNIMARLGSGFDIVSGGELERVIRAGGDPAKTIFSGVGKTAGEIADALEVGIQSINVESVDELDRVIEVASANGVVAPIGVRVNPDVDAKTHPYISTGLAENKFGVSMEDAPGVYRRAADSEHIRIHAIACHIGSQLTELSPYADAIDRVLNMVEALGADGIDVGLLDLGGGLGVRYRDEEPPLPADYAKVVLDVLKKHSCTLPVSIEPGRAIAANAGILVTEVQFLKTGDVKNFAIVDAAMNDLIRPTLYSAWQDIVPVNLNSNLNSTGKDLTWDIVGPICESGDWIGKDRDLTLSQGDLLAVRAAGAYGAVMSSNYNTRPRAPEVMVDKDTVTVVRTRETLDHLLAGESLLA